MKELDELALERCFQRLKEDLGLDEDAIEVILKLREQVVVLQDRLHSLESTLEIYEAGSSTRLTKYRQVVYEAEWEEVQE